MYKFLRNRPKGKAGESEGCFCLLSACNIPRKNLLQNIFTEYFFWISKIF